MNNNACLYVEDFVTGWVLVSKVEGNHPEYLHKLKRLAAEEDIVLN